MAPLVRMLIASFGSHVSRVCAAPVVFGDGCSLSSPRFCSWECDHRAFFSSFLCNWCSVAVSENLWNDVRFVFVGHRNAVPVCVFLRTCTSQLEYCFLWCSLFWLACWQTSVRQFDSGAFWAVCTTGFHLLSFCGVPRFWCQFRGSR